jgi:hypothetical protein
MKCPLIIELRGQLRKHQVNKIKANRINKVSRAELEVLLRHIGTAMKLQRQMKLLQSYGSYSASFSSSREA